MAAAARGSIGGRSMRTDRRNANKRAKRAARLEAASQSNANGERDAPVPDAAAVHGVGGPPPPPAVTHLTWVLNFNTRY